MLQNTYLTFSQNIALELMQIHFTHTLTATLLLAESIRDYTLFLISV